MPKDSPNERKIIIFISLLLLFLSGFLNYSSPYFYGESWRIFLHLPKMSEEISFSVWWLIIGLPLLLFFSALRFPNFRKILKALPRQKNLPLFLFFTLLFAFSLFPWEYSWVRPSKSHLTIYLILGSVGLIFLLIGIYPKLKFLEEFSNKFLLWLMNLNQKTFILLSSLLLFIISNLVSFLIFNHIPHISDSIAQLFQGRIFANGRLYLTSPPFPDFFDYGHIINNGRWYSQYQFLHPLFLMIGVLIKAPWLINPVLGTLTIPLVYLLGKEIYDEKTGRLAALFTSINPVIFMMSGEYMNHPTSLLFATIFFLFFFRAQREKKLSQGLIAGIALGLVANCRVYTAILIGIPFFFYALYLIKKEPRSLFTFLIMLFSFLGVAALNLLYNWLTNGNPFLFGYVVRWGPGHSIGFGKSGWGIKHTPLRGLINIGHDGNLLNKFLLEIPFPALFLVFFPFALGNKNRSDWLFLLTFLSLWFGHFFYWFHGIAFGARFLYEVVPVLIILLVRSGKNLGNLIRRAWHLNIPDSTINQFFARTLPLLFFLFLFIGLPPLLRMYYKYWGVDRNLLQRVKKEKIKNGLIFCQELGDAFNANPIHLKGEIIYAQDLGILNPALTLIYPNRHYYQGTKEGLKPLNLPPFPQSALKKILDSLASYLSESLINQYRTIICPFKDLPPEILKGSDKLTDFREVTISVMTQKRTLDDYLPALLLWVVGDPRPHLEIFRYLEKSAYFVAGPYKCKRLWQSSDNRALIAEINFAE